MKNSLRCVYLVSCEIQKIVFNHLFEFFVKSFPKLVQNRRQNYRGDITNFDPFPMALLVQKTVIEYWLNVRIFCIRDFSWKTEDYQYRFANKVGKPIALILEDGIEQIFFPYYFGKNCQLQKIYFHWRKFEHKLCICIIRAVEIVLSQPLIMGMDVGGFGKIICGM